MEKSFEGKRKTEEVKMISIGELKKIASARLKDAEVLGKGNRFDGAVYLCGYAIELILKARICKTLN